MVTQILPQKNIDEWVRKTAKELNISNEPDRLGRMALKITSLAGDDLVISTTETLIMNLHKKGHLSKDDALSLVSNHMREIKARRKNSGENSFPEPH